MLLKIFFMESRLLFLIISCRDDSTSKLADLLINGTNMGIIEGRKLLNNKIMDKKVKKICEEYIKFQERYLEKLKEFV